MTSNVKRLLIDYLNQIMKTNKRTNSNNIGITELSIFSISKFPIFPAKFRFSCFRHHRNQTCAMLAELPTSLLSPRSGKKKEKLKVRKRPTNTLKGPEKAIK